MSEFPLSDFRQLIAEMTSYNVIYADQNAPKETKPFIRLRFMSGSGTEHTETHDVDEEGNRDVSENQLSTLELNFYGPSAKAEADRIRARLGLPTVADNFNAKNLAVINRGQVINLTSLLSNSQYEQRYMLEVQCAWKSVEVENVGYIGQIEIDGILNHPPEPMPTGAEVEVKVDIGLE